MDNISSVIVTTVPNQQSWDLGKIVSFVRHSQVLLYNFQHEMKILTSQ